MKPLVSTRISLAWPPAPPEELTNTLVIQGRTGFFLDIRTVVKGAHIGELDWASAGIKKFLPGSTPDNPKASFEAVIDSRRFTSAPTDDPSPPDEGSFETLPNGDVLETGSMANPDAGGAIQEYEEVWRRFPIDQEQIEVAIFAREDEKAFVGRVGKWEVGMSEALEGEDGFAAWRFEEEPTSDWTEVARVGSAKRVVRVTSEMCRLKVREVVKIGSFEWKRTE